MADSVLMEAGIWFGVIVFTGMGALLWVLAARAIRLRLAMKRWPVLTGEVRDHRTRESRKSVHVDFEVSYRFAERDYLVWSTSPTGAGYGRGNSGPDREMARFPFGTTAPIRVNPERPEQAYLELPEQHVIGFMIGGGTLLLGLAASLVLSAIRDLPDELVTAGFFLLVAAVLGGWAVSTGIALYGARRRRR